MEKGSGGPASFRKSESESISHSVGPTLCDPMGCGPPGSFCLWNSPGKNTVVGSHSLLQGNLPNPGIKPASPALQMDSSPSEPPGKPPEESAISQIPVLLVTLSYLTLKGNT